MLSAFYSRWALDYRLGTGHFCGFVPDLSWGFSEDLLDSVY